MKNYTSEDLLNHPTFCVLPWIHFHGLPDGSIHPCCISTDVVDPITKYSGQKFIEIMNVDKFKQLRTQMLNGEKPSQCSSCLTEIFDNPNSFRNLQNSFFLSYKNDAEIVSLVNQTSDDGQIPSFDLKYYDIRFSNICDLKCRGCNEHVSSSWFFENSKNRNKNDASRPKNGVININTISPNMLDEVLNSDILKNIKKLYFAGGEPLLMKEHYLILDKLIQYENFDVNLTYNSNGMNFLYNGTFLQKLSNFNSLHMGVSLDDVGPRLEYYRAGAKWGKIKNNFKAFHNTIGNSNYKIGVQVTVSAFNIFYLPEIINGFFDDELISSSLDLDCYGFPINFNVLQSPVEQNINIFSDDQKNTIRSKLRNYVISCSLNEHYKNALSQKFEFLISYMENENGNRHFEKFKSEIAKLDLIRNESFASTYPELFEFCNFVNKNIN